MSWRRTRPGSEPGPEPDHQSCMMPSPSRFVARYSSQGPGSASKGGSVAVGQEPARRRDVRVTRFGFGVVVEPGLHRGGDLSERVELLRGEHVDEPATDVRDVPWCRLGDGALTGFGDLDEGAARVGGARYAVDQPPPGHPSQVMGQPGLLPLQPRAQLEDPQASLGRLAELHQHAVVGLGQAGLDQQLTVQPAVQFRLHGQEGTPGALLALIEPWVPGRRHLPMIPARMTRHPCAANASWRSRRSRPPSGRGGPGGGLTVSRSAPGQSSDTCTWSVWSLAPLYDFQPVAGNQICLYQIT